MNQDISLDVALDIIGTLRILKMKEISAEKDVKQKEILEREFDVLTVEERIAQGLMQFDGWEIVRLSIFDKIDRLYAPQLRAYHAAG